MNKTRVILISKLVFSLAFVGAFIASITNVSGDNGTLKTTILVTGALGIVGLVISFIEAASLNKSSKDSAENLKLIEARIVEKDDEIEKITNEVKEKTLLSERVAKLSKIIQEAEDVAEASTSILETLANDIEICQGVIYVTNENEDGTKFLKGAGTYAYHKLDSELDQPQFGVGLVGQTAQEKKSLYINELPTGYIDVVSGLGKAQPGRLALIPLMYSGETLGVIELASFVEFTEKDKELFEGIKNSLGAGIHFLEQAKVLDKLEAEIQSLKDNGSVSEIKSIEIEQSIADEPIIEEPEVETVESVEDSVEESEEDSTDEKEEENND